MRFSHITFDCYGTLIDWRKGIEERLGALLRQKGLTQGTRIFPLYVTLEAAEEGSYESYREVLKNTALRVGEQLSIEVSAEEATEFANSVAYWSPFSDTVETLRELGRVGYKRVILSNIDKDILEDTISRNGLEVDDFITADEVKSYKPAFGHWLRFLEGDGITKQRTVHVAGSVYHDIIPAKKLGFTTVWVNRYSEGNPAGTLPDFMLSDLRSLLSLPDIG
jgi:2-haloalkanoic acid dehalogenase type II